MSPRPTHRDEVSGGGWLFIIIAMPLDPAIGYAMVVECDGGKKVLN
jgi:hypothetical protein